ncbi:putative surface layer protein [Oscillibacter sp. CAG:155]|nr:putative surface layer protein [Oscillibacter sp. CAG:155]
MYLKNRSIKRFSVLALGAVLLLSVNALALFGTKEADTQPEEGAPVAGELSISTYRGIPYEAQLLGSDAEGDDLTFAVVDEPRKGTVEIDGANFTYTPEENATGADRFTYAVTDSAGHVSQPATVSVTIEKTKSGVTYSDTAGSAAAAAAQDLAEQGIFVGARIGDQYYFEPERTVSRSEFVAMALETAGRDVTAVTMTGFCDDAAIPTWVKAYAAAGVAEGIVQGTSTAEGVAFRGNSPITFNEAATVLNRLLDVEDVDLAVWYAGRETVPSWAAQAVGNLEAVNVLAVGSFGSDSLDTTITRADAARMLSAARTVLDQEKDDGGLFGWLS